MNNKLIYFTLVLISTLAKAQESPFNFFSTNVATKDAGISAGVAVGDYNNDNFPDVFVCNIGRNNFLYKNNGDGSFQKIITGAIVSDGGRSSGAVWGDYNGDGYLDLFVANQQNEHNFLYKNNGNETFTRIFNDPIVSDFGDSYSANWIDLNSDGNIDLYVANTRKQNDFLYQNQGDGTFKRVMNSGIAEDAETNWGAGFSDIDNDGDVDLFLPVRDGGQDHIYINNGNGKFKLIDLPIFNKRRTDSNAVSFADFDNDGDQDVFVANGTKQENELYINHGNLNFSKASKDIITFEKNNSGLGAWGDFNNDGYLDLFVMNYGEFDVLYLSNKGKKFVRESKGFLVNIGGFGSGLSVFDLENDGDLDLFLANWENQNNKLYKNRTKNANWLKIKCMGNNNGINGIGTRINIYHKGDTGKTMRQSREIISDIGRRSQNGYTQHFGLGNIKTIDLIVVEWPNGKNDELKNVSANQTIVIKEGKGLYKSISGKILSETKSQLLRLVDLYNKKSVNHIIQEVDELSKKNILEESSGVTLARYIESKEGIKPALKILNLVLKPYPDSSGANLWKGVFLKRLGKNKSAKKNLIIALKMLEFNPKKNASLINLCKYTLKEIKYLEN